MTPIVAKLNKKIVEQENLLLQKNNQIDVLENKNAELVAIMAAMESDRDELKKSNSVINTRLSTANSKYMALRSEVEADKLIALAVEKSGVDTESSKFFIFSLKVFSLLTECYLSVQYLVESIQTLPALIEKLNASVAEAQVQLFRGTTTVGQLDDSMLPEPTEEIVPEQQANINVPADETEKWQYFR